MSFWGWMNQQVVRMLVLANAPVCVVLLVKMIAPGLVQKAVKVAVRASAVVVRADHYVKDRININYDECISSVAMIYTCFNAQY